MNATTNTDRIDYSSDREWGIAKNIINKTDVEQMPGRMAHMFWHSKERHEGGCHETPAMPTAWLMTDGSVVVHSDGFVSLMSPSGTYMERPAGRGSMRFNAVILRVRARAVEAS